MSDTVITGTSSGSLAVRPDQHEWTEPQKAALAQLGIADAPRGDQLVFLHVSQRMGLDPFNREIYMIGRWDPVTQKTKWTIQIGIDGFRSKSEEHPEYAGVSGPEWCGPDGEWRDVWLKDEPPVAARFTVFRRDWAHPIHAIAHYREYVQLKNGQPTTMWRTRPAGQIGKCAEALARRKAFPRRLTGVYLAEELDHLDNAQPAPVRVESERVEQEPEPDWDSMIRAAEEAVDKNALTKVWNLARGFRRNDSALLEKIAKAGERINQTLAQDVPVEMSEEPTQTPDQGKATQTQKNKLFALLRDGEISGTDRALRLRIASRILNRPPAESVTSFDQLSAQEVDAINEFLLRHKNEGDLEHTLRDLGTEPPQE